MKSTIISSIYKYLKNNLLCLYNMKWKYFVNISNPIHFWITRKIRENCRFCVNIYLYCFRIIDSMWYCDFLILTKIPAYTVDTTLHQKPAEDSNFKHFSALYYDKTKRWPKTTHITVQRIHSSSSSSPKN